MLVWRYICVLFAGLTIAVAGAASAAPQAAEEASAAGRDAFTQGDYASALEYFLAARRAGLSSPRLTYNLGVTYYRLARYQDAQTEFQRLLSDEALAPTAHYNLGLIALKSGDTPLARGHFQQAYDAATSPSLKDLAARALVRAQPARPTRRTSGLLSFGAGYDSNVALVEDADELPAREKGDAYSEVLAGIRHPLSDTLELEAGLYARSYPRVDEFAQSSLRVGVMDRAQGEVWRTGIGAHVDRLYLSGDVFQTVGTLTLEATRPLQEGAELRVRYRPSRIEAVAPYDYLTGWRHRAGAQLRWPLGPARLTLGYDLELNNRNDLDQTVDFASRSAHRNALSAQLGYALNADWDLTVAGRYRHSRYAADRGALQPFGDSRRRVDEEYEVELRADRRLGAQWYLVARYLYTNNQSTDADFDYTRHETMLGLERAF